ncbi:MAG TPA: ChbG/HpnK family deacetylase, partial [Blastocatellia bacterium]|nr:ChbG/HpnK family deacetylase [Blastocatellia bacterium]
MKKISASLLLLMLPTLLIGQRPRAFAHAGETRAAPVSLAERLGFKATDKILIINVDDVGGSHAANAAAIEALESGLATSATIMVPCPWFPEVAAYAKAHQNSDFGLHLTHT